MSISKTPFLVHWVKIFYIVGTKTFCMRGVYSLALLAIFISMGSNLGNFCPNFGHFCIKGAKFWHFFIRGQNQKKYFDNVRDFGHIEVTNSTESRKTRKIIININFQQEIHQGIHLWCQNGTNITLDFLYNIYNAILAHFAQTGYWIALKVWSTVNLE